MERHYPDALRTGSRLSPSASSTMARRLARQSAEELPAAPNLRGPEPAEIDERREEWDWERWAERSEGVGRRLAQSLDRVTWGGIGALLGTAVAALPAFLFGFESYPFVVAQPLGAALGALGGILAMTDTWGTTPREVSRNAYARGRRRAV